MKRQKIYIAGFDVFKADSIAIGKEYQNLCEQYGYEGLYPLDNVANFDQPKQKIAQDIFTANRNMIDICDIVIANINPFRGKEADSGTIWECGYAVALGKKVYGYMDDTCDYVDSFTNAEKVKIYNEQYDANGMAIEDFNYPINLMIACSSQIVKGEFEDVLKAIKNKEN